MSVLIQSMAVPVLNLLCYIIAEFSAWGQDCKHEFAPPGVSGPLTSLTVEWVVPVASMQMRGEKDLPFWSLCSIPQGYRPWKIQSVFAPLTS
jgi:hypothetical protein